MENNNNEIRFYGVGVEVRASEDNQPPKLGGIAVPYDKPSQVLTDQKTGRRFIEVVKPGAFAKTLSDPEAEVRADVGHQRQQVIARRSKGTLVLNDQPEGLTVEITPPATTLGRDTVEDVRSGNKEGLSMEFSIRQGGETWSRTSATAPNGTPIWQRTLTDLNLYRVAVVSEPAYPDTTVAVRSLEQAEKLLDESTKEVGEVAPKAEENTDGYPVASARARLTVAKMKAGEY